MGRVYAVASAKGGVGKTTTTASLGAALAAAGHRVAVVDADVGLSNLARLLGVDPDGPTIHDVLAGDAEPAEAVYEGPAGLDVVPGSSTLEAFANAEPRNLRTLLDALDDYDVVLLDTGAGLSHDTVLPLKLADAVILVATPTPDAIAGTAKTRELAARLDTRVLGLVLTQSPTDPDLGAVAAQLPGVTVLGTVPTDAALAAAVDAGQPVGSRAPDSPAANAYRRLADVVLADAVPTKSSASPSAARVADPEPDAETGAGGSVASAGGTVPQTEEAGSEASAEPDSEASAESDSEASDEVDAGAVAAADVADGLDDHETVAEGADEGGLAATLEAVETASDATVDDESTAEEVVADAVEEAEPTTETGESGDDEEPPTETVLSDEIDSGVTIPDAESDRAVDPADADSATDEESSVSDDTDDGDRDDMDDGDAVGGRGAGGEGDDGDDEDDTGDGDSNGGKKKGFLRRLFG